MASPGELTLADVRQRAAELFFDDVGAPAVKPALPAAIQQPTNELIIHVFEASKDIKLVRGKLSREDVMGYLIADYLGVELLAEEALRLGASVRKAATAAKDGDNTLRNVASARKSKLRKKAEKDPVHAARLEAELHAVDAEAVVARALLLNSPIKLAGLPDAGSQVVERRAPPSHTKPPPAGPSHMRSEDCGEEMCPRALALLDMAMSKEAAMAIVPAFKVFTQIAQHGSDAFFNEKLELAEVQYKHALRRLKQVYPDEFCGFSENSAWEVVSWTIRLSAFGQTIPAAVAAARAVGFDLQMAAAEYRVRYPSGANKK